MYIFYLVRSAFFFGCCELVLSCSVMEPKYFALLVLVKCGSIRFCCIYKVLCINMNWLLEPGRASLSCVPFTLCRFYCHFWRYSILKLYQVFCICTNLAFYCYNSALIVIGWFVVALVLDQWGLCL